MFLFFNVHQKNFHLTLLITVSFTFVVVVTSKPTFSLMQLNKSEGFLGTANFHLPSSLKIIPKHRPKRMLNKVKKVATEFRKLGGWFWPSVEKPKSPSEKEIMAYLLKMLPYGLVLAVISFLAGVAFSYLTEENNVSRASTVLYVYPTSSGEGDAPKRHWAPNITFTIIVIALILLYIGFFFLLVRIGRRKGPLFYCYLHKLGVI